LIGAIAACLHINKNPKQMTLDMDVEHPDYQWQLIMVKESTQQKKHAVASTLARETIS